MPIFVAVSHKTGSPLSYPLTLPTLSHTGPNITSPCLYFPQHHLAYNYALHNTSIPVMNIRYTTYLVTGRSVAFLLHYISSDATSPLLNTLCIHYSAAWLILVSILYCLPHSSALTLNSPFFHLHCLTLLVIRSVQHVCNLIITFNEPLWSYFRYIFTNDLAVENVFIAWLIHATNSSSFYAQSQDISVPSTVADSPFSSQD